MGSAATSALPTTTTAPPPPIASLARKLEAVEWDLPSYSASARRNRADHTSSLKPFPNSSVEMVGTTVVADTTATAAGSGMSLREFTDRMYPMLSSSRQSIPGRRTMQEEEEEGEKETDDKRKRQEQLDMSVTP
eukprot:jgi/Bigna1/127554/aug1.4_g2262